MFISFACRVLEVPDMNRQFNARIDLVRASFYLLCDKVCFSFKLVSRLLLNLGVATEGNDDAIHTNSRVYLITLARLIDNLLVD